ncbi:UPF0664 stress-induced protein [Smittium mucronatum]|uniref:UPF0664 stress-induced protein n=1 Tax=Smittium mucronatum TaxID=133383 RepID=A0A1R0H9N7_9FUNG|nr:UPF0664 stress-induced protein [Smittium mucronatum]
MTFSVPHTYILNPKFQQPIFGANYLHLDFEPVPEGGLPSNGKLKLIFKEAGGFDFYTIFMQMLDRIRETGEIPSHNEVLPSYSEVVGEQNTQPANNLQSTDQNNLPVYDFPPSNFNPDEKR